MYIYIYIHTHSNKAGPLAEQAMRRTACSYVYHSCFMSQYRCNQPVCDSVCLFAHASFVCLR